MSQISAILTLINEYEPQNTSSLKCTILHTKELYLSLKVPSLGMAYPDPLSVAHILAEWHVPSPLIVTAMYSIVMPHGTLEDFDSVLPHANYARIALQLVKLNDLLARERFDAQSHTDLERNMRYLRANLLRNSQRELWPPGLILLVVAIFLDLLKQGVQMEATDRKSLAVQAHVLFKPVCERYGLWLIRREIRKLAFRCEDPEEYRSIENYLESRRQRIDIFCNNISTYIEGIAEANGIAAYSMHPMLAYPYKVRELLKSHAMDLFPHDLVSFVALLPEIEDCHVFSRMLQMIGNPRNSFRNFLDYPKTNDYRSLHMSIPIPDYSSGPVLFYIRTKYQDEINTSGVIFRWQNGEYPQLFDEERMLILPPLGKIFVFERKGKPHILPEGALMADLAYKIGETAGNNMLTGLIYGMQGSIESDHVLDNGDIVRINAGKGAKHNAGLLTKVKTRKARDSIKLHLDRVDNPLTAIESAVTELTNNVGDNIAIAEAISLPKEWEKIPVHPCQQCKPYPPQGIVGYKTTEQTITVHTRECPIISTRDAAQLYDLKWHKTVLRQASVMLDIELWDGIGRLEFITHAISKHGLNICEIVAKVSQNRTAHVSVSLQSGDKAIIDSLYHHLEQQQWIHKITTIYDRTSPLVVYKQVDHLNPYSPVPDSSRRNPSIFYGRAQETRDAIEVISDQEPYAPIILWGQQRIGKTSLLRHLENIAYSPEILINRYVPISLSMINWDRTMATPSEWLGIQLDKAIDKARNQEQGIVPEDYPRWENFTHNSIAPTQTSGNRAVGSQALESYIGNLQQALGAFRLVIMLDEFQEMAHLQTHQHIDEFMQSLLSLIARHECVFIFSGWGLQFREACKRWFEHMQPCQLTLDVLDERATFDLICKPVKQFLNYDPPAVEKFYTVTRGHPYFVHLLCYRLTNEALSISSTNKVHLSIAHVENQVKDLLTGNNQLFNHLMDLENIPKDESRNVLKSLAQATRVREEGVTFGQIMHQLGNTMAEERALQIVHDFKELNVLEAYPKNSECYRIYLPLLQMWLEQNP